MENPLEKIEKDKRLSAILTGLKGMWSYNDEFLCIVLWHTDDFDLANVVIQTYMDGDDDMDLEEALFNSMAIAFFKEKCLDSDFLTYSKCKALVDSYVEEEE